MPRPSLAALAWGGSTLSACWRLGECMLDVRLMVRSRPDGTSLTPRPVRVPPLEGGCWREDPHGSVDAAHPLDLLCDGRRGQPGA